MKKGILKSLMFVGAVLAMVGCVEEYTPPEKEALPMSELTQDLKDSITFMYNEEGLAYDVYLNVYNTLLDEQNITVKQLKMIAENAEIQHMAAVDALAIKYDLNMTTYDPTIEPYSKEGIGNGVYSIPHIQDLYNKLYAKGTTGANKNALNKNALEMGCIVEVVDIIDLQGYIVQAEEANATDVLKEFDFLITGSYTHYWAFDKALRTLNGDVNNSELGCCSIDDSVFGSDFCHPEYPNVKM
ncbi:DUF2202 domain-containing protein [Campylobacterota bacterium]